MESQEQQQDQSAVMAQNVSKEDRAFLERHADKLSQSTLRAKWINSVDEHEDRPGQTLATRNHDVIRRWAEERGAVPATVPGTEHGDRAGVLRFIFSGQGDGEDPSRLEPISWEEWFKTFDERQLVFVFQEHKADGSQSNFFRFDSPDRQDA
ncbi:MAG: hypothetical protein QOG89_3544 [Thermomicrobiales bacterium]|nr:hypothetical protein [Thermomicrobiales bacterium]